MQTKLITILLLTPLFLSSQMDTIPLTEMNKYIEIRDSLESQRQEWERTLIIDNGFIYSDGYGVSLEKYNRSTGIAHYYLNFIIHQWEISPFDKCRNLSIDDYTAVYQDMCFTLAGKDKSQYVYMKRHPDLSFEAYMDYVITNK